MASGCYIKIKTFYFIASHENKMLLNHMKKLLEYSFHLTLIG